MTRNAFTFKEFFPPPEQANQPNSKEESVITAVRQGFMEDEYWLHRRCCGPHFVFFEVFYPNINQDHLAWLMKSDKGTAHGNKDARQWFYFLFYSLQPQGER